LFAKQRTTRTAHISVCCSSGPLIRFYLIRVNIGTLNIFGYRLDVATFDGRLLATSRFWPFAGLYEQTDFRSTVSYRRFVLWIAQPSFERYRPWKVSTDIEMGVRRTYGYRALTPLSLWSKIVRFVSPPPLPPQKTNEAGWRSEHFYTCKRTGITYFVLQTLKDNRSKKKKFNTCIT